MPKIANELSALAVRKLATIPGGHPVGGVRGLQLQVTKQLQASWILRVVVSGGARREFGLGPYNGTTLMEAREKARKFREELRAGNDPSVRAATRKKRQQDLASKGGTFKASALRMIEAKKTGWKNPVHVQQWLSTLQTYAYPVLGDKKIEEITLEDVLAVLEPIWGTKTETADRLRGRIERVISWAITQNRLNIQNVARWRGHLDTVLATPSKVKQKRHHPALPFDRIGEFYAALRQREGASARALEYLIQTAARTGEVLGATWSEVDMDNARWIIPAARMKAGKEHVVPLNRIAMGLLYLVPASDRQGFLFTNRVENKLSNMSLIALIRRMHDDNLKQGMDGFFDRVQTNEVITPHGFRSTFRDWVAERTDFGHEIAEMALAHTIPNKAEAAYRRGSMIEKREVMMASWADQCWSGNMRVP